jgi:hypothetical protein
MKSATKLDDPISCKQFCGTDTYWVHQIFHQLFYPILSTNFSQFEQLKMKTNFLLVQNRFFFSHFSNWKRNHNKFLLKKIVDSEFEIGETIWWAYRQLGKLTFTVDYSLESICLSSTHKSWLSIEKYFSLKDKKNC